MIDEKSLKSFLKKKYFKQLSEKRNLVSATVEILNFCNFKCIHCYNQNLKSCFLSKETFFNLIDSMVKLGCKNITLTGGEPTLHPNFEEFYRYCNHKNLKITLFTNGYYLNKYLDLFLEIIPDKIEISIYGSGNKTYKEICKVDNGFDIVNKNIQLLKSHNLPVYTKSVIMQQNVKEYHKINEYVQKLKLPYRLDLAILKSKDFKNLQENTKLLDKQFTSMLNEVRNEKEKLWKDCLDKEQDEFKQNMLYTCGAGRMSLFVGSNGGVRLCNFAAFSEMSINDYSLTEIWKSFEKYINLKKDKTSECYNCKYKKVCTNCPVMTYMEHQTDGLNILPVAQNCREAKNIYKILKENE